ncbi:galactose-binding like protein [Lentithecium fluviatile CBS 122367]|uniref:Galactose-binding like protein n=1 Tax=Lentithecium fluviatile CBS 122367 TaxID=1168545 RepID=A0A6G1IZP4_9PLEO|nr:galactose-binding like protein [Lentithecium fluviatile CBS 122367]
MPPSLRRRGQPPPQPSSEEPFSESEDEYVEEGVGEEDEEGLEQTVPDMEDEDDEGEEDEEPLDSPTHPSTHLIPPHYREISTLASWTASSSKPGCSIPQLRHPSTSLFWQSDGPQPHYLNIHFFKLVRIVGLRLYLDFEADESYTPTRIVLLAGSGMNDLVEWGEMRLESPRGWVWANFEGVGEASSGEESEDEEEDVDDVIAGHFGQGDHAGLGIPLPQTLPHDTSDSENAAPPAQQPAPTTATTHDADADTDADPMTLDPTPIPQFARVPTTHPLHGTPTLSRPTPRLPFTPLSSTASPGRTTQPRARKPKMPVLRCHLVQIKILENHQNGKDTHLRGLQIFARDNEGKGKKSMVSVGGGGRDGGTGARGNLGRVLGGERKRIGGLTKSEWMAEPVLR